MNIRTQAILFVQLTIIVLVTTYLTMAIKQQQQDFQDRIQAKKENALFLAKNLQQQAFSHYQQRINGLATTNSTTKRQVVDSFAKHDRVALYKAMSPYYKILTKENPYFRNIQFNLPDGTTFLRMHLPDFHSDDLSTIRPIINHVHNAKKPAAGYEIGRSGLFFRILHPIFQQGKYIGSIGFGIKHDQLLELLQKQISPHTALVIDANRWQKATLSKLQVVKKGNEVMLPLGSPLLTNLPKDYVEGSDKPIHIKGHDYVIFSNITLNDYQKQPIVKVLVALDVTKDVAALKTFIIKTILLTLVLLILTGIVLHFSFGQLLDKILQLNNSLTQSNEELEKRVNDRTIELKESNLALKEEITERMRLESDLLQAEKMRAMGTLASGIAHDFNNILTAILGYSQLGLLQIKKNQDITPHLEKVVEAGLRAKDLVEQILTFSRQSDQKNQPIKLHTIVEETLNLLQASIPANIEFITHIDPNCCDIFVNPTQTHQVVMNLCTNAHHAMLDQGGTLTISLQQIVIKPEDGLLEPAPGSYTTLTVDDTGTGMDSDTLERIFDPYFTTKSEGEGTGLGMAVVHGIIKSFNGHITVKTSPGKGSSFTVYLPCYMGQETHEEEALDDTIQRGQNEHLLVVDDEKILLLFWEGLLTQLGYTVTTMEDSQAAYQWLCGHITEVDGIITDMSMPHLTGLELSKKIHDLDPSMPIALCSGYSSTELPQKMQNSGIKAYIKKPVDTLTLSQTLRTLLTDK